MGLGGGDVGQHGRDNDPGYGGNGGNGIGGGNSANISDVTKAMLSSPSAQQYNDYYASKLGVMGQPGAQWGDFTGSINNIASGLYDRAKTGFLGLVDAPMNFANRFGANIPTVSTPPQMPIGLRGLQDPTPKEIARAYRESDMVPSDAMIENMRSLDKVDNPDKWGWGDALTEPMAAFTEKAITSTLNPLAAVAMLSANIPPEVLANPATKQATGFLTSGIAGDLANRAMWENTYDKVMGSGIYGGNPSYGIGQATTETGEDVTGLNYRPNYQPEFTQRPSYGGYLRYGNYYS